MNTNDTNNLERDETEEEIEEIEEYECILRMNKLRELIAYLCNTTPQNVIINTKNNLNINCCDCCRLLNTVTIEDIYIKNGDLYQSFHIYYNEEYNRILEEFEISLLKVFDGYDITEMVDGDYEM